MRSPQQQQAEPQPEQAVNQDKRKRVVTATALWMAIASGGVLIIGVLATWHLVRRGRLIRERLSPPKPVRWPELNPEPQADSNSPTE